MLWVPSLLVNQTWLVTSGMYLERPFWPKLHTVYLCSWTDLQKVYTNNMVQQVHEQKCPRTDTLSKTDLILCHLWKEVWKTLASNLSHQNVGVNTGCKLNLTKSFPTRLAGSTAGQYQAIWGWLPFSQWPVDLKETTTGFWSIVGPARPASPIGQGVN